MPLDLEPIDLDLEPLDEPAERPTRFSDEMIAALPERERRRLDLLSEMAAEQGAAERRAPREALFEKYLYPAAEGALTALSLSPSAIARTVEKGVPATAAVVRGEETFTPAPPVVSGFLNPEIEGGTNALKIPHIPGGESALTQIPAGLGNAVIEFANIFTTPEGILSLGIGGLPKAAQRAVVGTMGANLAAHYPEEFNAAIEAAKAGDLEQATRRIIATPVMASVMGRASMEPVNVPRAPEFPGLPDPDLVARNLAEPGTFRPQEQYGAPRIEPPAGMFEAGEVPFERMQRFSTMEVGEPQVLPSTGLLPEPRIIEETRPKVQTETRGKVSFGAEAPTLLRTAIQGAEEVGLTKAAEAARKVQDASQVSKAAEVHGDVRAQPPEGQGQVPAQESGARVQPQESQVLLKPKLVAAIKTASGRTYTGERHPFALANAMDQIRETGGTKAGEMAAELADAQQGFLDVQSGQFLTRSEAAKKMGATGELTSEMIPEPDLKANVAELAAKQAKPVGAQPVIERINQLPVEEAVKLNQKPEMFEGLNLKPEDAPALKQASADAFARFEKELTAGNEAAAQAEYGKGTFFNGAIEWANKKGPNYEAAQKLKEQPVTTETVTTPPPAAEGVISGSAAEKWADQVLGKDPRTKARASLDPLEEGRRIAAVAIKGAAIIERGVRDFAAWSAEMIKTYGPEIQKDLQRIFGMSNAYVDQSAKMRQGQLTPSAGAPPVPPTPPRPPAAGSAPAPRPPSRGPATLDDIYKIFETDPKPSPSIKQRIVKASESFRTGFSSAFRPLNKLAEDVSKSYGGTAKDVAGQFEQLKGSSGKAEADVYRFDQDVSKTVKGNEKDFNAYMFLLRSLDRLNRDIATGETRRKVSGYTVPELEAKLSLLESKLTPDQRAQFQSAADNFQRHMDEALKLQVDSGRMAPEVYNAIKEGNQFYAPFKVMKYLEETSRPEGTGRRVDTPASFVKAMEGIESETFKLGDMLAAARQNISISRVLAEKNRAMQNITELAAFDVNESFIRKLGRGEEVPKGMEAVNVFENGTKERYAVNPDVAAAVQIHGPQSGTLLARIAGNMFRIGATTANVPFQAANLMADVPRQALVSKYGPRSPTDLVRYPLDYMEALYSSMTGNFGRRNKLYLDFLDSGAAGSTVQQFLTPEALRFDPSPQSRSAAFAKSVLSAVPDFANAIEQTSKIVGVKRAMRVHGVESGKALARQVPEAITEIRRFSGSPDFGRSGKWTDQARLNLLYMFFNARVQGAVADIGRLGGRDGAGTAGKTWFKLGAAIGLPTLYAYLINNSDEYREDYAKRSDQEKRNYWLIPKDSFITSSSGEKMRDYWRIPKRETAKWMGNFVEAGMDFAREREPDRFAEWAGRTLEDVFPVNIEGKTAQERLESVAASLNPLFKAPLEVATGRDMYRHKAIVPESMRKASPEEQYTDRTSQVFRTLADSMPDVAPEVFRSPLMLENMTKNVTAGLITQFLPRQPVEGRGAIENFPLTQRFQAVPYSDSTAFEERMQGLERESADEQLARFRNADELIKKMRGSTIDQIVKRSMELHGPDRKQVEKIVELWTATQRGVTPNERRILALPTQQRAQFIIGELEGKTPEEKAALLRDYSIKRILTEAVAEQMIEQQPQR